MSAATAGGLVLPGPTELTPEIESARAPGDPSSSRASAARCRAIRAAAAWFPLRDLERERHCLALDVLQQLVRSPE